MNTQLLSEIFIILILMVIIKVRKTVKVDVTLKVYYKIYILK